MCFGMYFRASFLANTFIRTCVAGLETVLPYAIH
jgi:hypothetical protein